MSKAEFRVVIDGPEKAREQLLNALKDLEGEAQRSGVSVSVQRVERSEIEAEFSTGSEVD